MEHNRAANDSVRCVQMYTQCMSTQHIAHSIITETANFNMKAAAETQHQFGNLEKNLF